MIIVDYIDGAGGEYLSYFINSHKELDNFIPNEEVMRNPAEFKAMNIGSISYKNWNEIFQSEYGKILGSLKVVPYHLYKFPHHIDIIRNLDPGSRFIKICSEDSDNIVKHDFLRKIFLRKFTNKDLQEIKILINTFDNGKKAQVLQRLKYNDLYHLDLHLIDNGLSVSRKNRLDAIYNFINKKITPPSSDIIINYIDFFVDFDKTANAYQELCDNLSITFDKEKLDLLLLRNKKNYTDVTKFIDNFTVHLEKL